ncbi:hypothetical protein [Ectobacillus ponti]|uniref:Uncharacterized protein n=1 Tax=Ectobacillus ponti TaxID=2961894 RepID=A0AA42BTJ8_9BACI|nr:hypothetical protein [Ectobacillus ponti]MCP8969553.1 hypothetical protein [Ectobacillus ponti]
MAARAAELKIYVFDKRDLWRFFWLECVVGPFMYLSLKRHGVHDLAAFGGTMAGTAALKYAIKQTEKKKVYTWKE